MAAKKYAAKKGKAVGKATAPGQVKKATGAKKAIGKGGAKKKPTIVSIGPVSRTLPTTPSIPTGEMETWGTFTRNIGTDDLANRYPGIMPHPIAPTITTFGPKKKKRK